MQQPAGVVGAAERGGEHARPVRVAAHEADQRAVHAAGVGDRLQLGQQLRAHRAGRPGAPPRWSSRRRTPTTGRSGRPATRPGRPRCRGRGGRRSRSSGSPVSARNPAATACACDGTPTHHRTASRGGGAQPVGVAAGPDQAQQLRHPDVARVGLADPLPQRARLRRSGARPRRAARRAGRARRGGSWPGSRGGAGRKPSAARRKSVSAERKAADPCSSRALAVSSSPSACRSASPVRAASSLISRAIAIRSPARPGVQRTSWRASRHAARVAGSSSVRARASACSESGRARGRCAGTEWCSSRARLAARWASSAVPRAVQRGERGLQLLDHGVAGHREPGAEPLHAQRDPAEPLGVPAGGRAAAGVVEQRPRPARVARSGAGVGLLDEQVDEHARPRPAHRLSSTARRARARCAGRLREGQPGAARRAPRGGPSPRPGRRPPAARPRRVWRARSAAATAPPRARRCSSASAMLLVQPQPARHLQPGRDRLAEQVVGEPGGVPSASRTSTPACTPSSMSRVTVAASWPDTSASTSGSRSLPATAAASTSARHSAEQPSHAAGDDVPHGRRHRRRGPRLDEQLGELTGEERVAVGAPVDLGGPACRRPRRPRRPVTSAATSRRSSPDSCTGSAARGQLDEHLGRRLGQLVGPVRADDHQRHRAVGPRRRTAAAPASRRRPTAGRRARRARAPGGRAAPGSRATASNSRSRAASVSTGRQSTAAPGSGARPCLTAACPDSSGSSRASSRPRSSVTAGPRRAQQAAQRGGPRPERGCPLRVGARAPADRPPAARRRLADQRGLADARLAADEHQPRRPLAASSTARRSRDSARARPTNATPGLCSVSESRRTDHAEPRACFWRIRRPDLAPRGRPVRRGGPR